MPFKWYPFSDFQIFGKLINVKKGFSEVLLCQHYKCQFFLLRPDYYKVEREGREKDVCVRLTVEIELKSKKERDKWFKDYNSYLTSEGKRLGKLLLKVQETSVTYIHKKLAVTYADAHKKKLRGYTRILTAEDKLGWFDDDSDGKGRTKIVANPDETYLS